jgi:hypothetical protein
MSEGSLLVHLARNLIQTCFIRQDILAALLAQFESAVCALRQTTD